MILNSLFFQKATINGLLVLGSRPLTAQSSLMSVVAFRRASRHSVPRLDHDEKIIKDQRTRPYRLLRGTPLQVLNRSHVPDERHGVGCPASLDGPCHVDAIPAVARSQLSFLRRRPVQSETLLSIQDILGIPEQTRHKEL